MRAVAYALRLSGALVQRLLDEACRNDAVVLSVVQCGLQAGGGFAAGGLGRLLQAELELGSDLFEACFVGGRSVLQLFLQRNELALLPVQDVGTEFAQADNVFAVVYCAGGDAAFPDGVGFFVGDEVCGVFVVDVVPEFTFVGERLGQALWTVAN